jgi:hypothetical protein
LAEGSETGHSLLSLIIGVTGSFQHSIRQLLLFFIYNKHFGVNEEIAAALDEGGQDGSGNTPAIDCHSIMV